jgi:hypothetical protein
VCSRVLYLIDFHQKDRFSVFWFFLLFNVFLLIVCDEFPSLYISIHFRICITHVHNVIKQTNIIDARVKQFRQIHVHMDTHICSPIIELWSLFSKGRNLVVLFPPAAQG